jgi:hypothetical protein
MPLNMHSAWSGALEPGLRDDRMRRRDERNRPFAGGLVGRPTRHVQRVTGSRPLVGGCSIRRTDRSSPGPPTAGGGQDRHVGPLRCYPPASNSWSPIWTTRPASAGPPPGHSVAASGRNRRRDARGDPPLQRRGHPRGAGRGPFGGCAAVRPHRHRCGTHGRHGTHGRRPGGSPALTERYSTAKATAEALVLAADDIDVRVVSKDAAAGDPVDRRLR